MKIPAKRNALISLQFYRDKSGKPNFLITCNEESENLFNGLDKSLPLFAAGLVESNRLNSKELRLLCELFKEVELQLDRIKAVSAAFATPT